MIFGLLRKLRNRVSRGEIEVLRTAEMSLGISLVDTYTGLSKLNRAVFLAHAKEYNREHAEYLEMLRKHDKAE